MIVYLLMSIEIYLYVSIQVAIWTVFNLLQFMLANLQIQHETMFSHACKVQVQGLNGNLQSHLNQPFCDTGQFAGGR